MFRQKTVSQKLSESNTASVSRIPIKITVEKGGEVQGELIRYLAPRTVDAIVRALPIEGFAALWKEEVYFETPVIMGDEKAKAKVQKGDLAYWPMGKAFCIFYGESQPYSPVNIIGKVTMNLELFANVKSGSVIRVEKI
jgi:hypothetical protein